MQMHVAMPNLKPEGNSMPDAAIFDQRQVEDRHVGHAVAFRLQIGHRDVHLHFFGSLR